MIVKVSDSPVLLTPPLSNVGVTTIFATCVWFDELRTVNAEIVPFPLAAKPIDILSFNDEIINNNDLILPHSKIKFRKFVLKPWTDIASDYILPNSKMTIKEHLDKISHLEDEIREYR